ncbi:MAG: HesA/MoeB/ThiF family protein [Candidatus Bathyarchaeia archaeon]
MSSDVFRDEELEYYSRQIVLDEIGLEGQRRLRETRALVVGLGGLGSQITPQLATMGVGHLRIVDRDVVEVSNLQRQHLYTMNDLGYPKAEAARNRLHAMNPHIQVEPIPASVTPSTVEDLLDDVDVVLDALDGMRPRYILNRACVENKIPYVHGAVIQQIGDAFTVIPGETACLECFKGGLSDEDLPTCATVGVLPTIISVIASIQVSEALRIILGKKPNLAGILLHCNMEDLSFDRIEIKPTEGCGVCGEGELEPIQEEQVEEICGREGRRVYMINPEEIRELDLSELREAVSHLGYDLSVKGELGITFHGREEKISIMKSGHAVIEGVDGKDMARQLYQKLLDM